MMRHHILRGRKSGRARSSGRIRLELEPLEERTLLSTLSIADENQLPGVPASVWDISGAGDPSLQGFATDISVNQGQTVSFKIDDTSRASYHIDIYRMGYYQGNGARLVASIPSSQAQRQPSPLTDATTGLVDCGNWSVSASWAVPSDATSGIYFARLTRDDTGGASHVFFVIRDDTDHSQILFKTSDSTWQAYNTYGGNDIENPDHANRAYESSYNRPFNTRATTGGEGDQNWVFNAEYPMVRWLEANGYDVSYFTDVDTNRNGGLIKNHQVFLSVGHDEYWSGDERANVEAARDAGVNLAFFSGNEIFRKTRWEPRIDGSGTTYRTLIIYNESYDNLQIDFLDSSPTWTWTGTWRDSRFSPPADGGRPENALSGTLYMDNNTGNDVGISMEVPAADATLRFWRNTSVATLAPGQVATLGDRVVGYEADEDLDNGFRPAGLIDMSSTTFESTSQVLVPWGTEWGPGTSTHSITLYRAPSGALVFGAGTVQWSWGLDGNHDDGNSTPDVNMQQATVNLLADMGVQPVTLQSGLVPASRSTDTSPPTSTVTAPTAGASFPNGTTVTITGTAVDAGGGVVGGVEVSVDGGVTWHPATGRENWTYTWTPNGIGPVTIKSRAVDDSGNLETPSAGVNVSLTGPISIWSASTTPRTASEPDDSPIEVGVKFRSDVPTTILGLRFYKGTGNSGTHIGNIWFDGDLLATATFTNETATGWQQVLFANPVTIAANATYVASYFAPDGYYSADDWYFSGLNSGINSGPLHVLSNAEGSGNGVYTYGSGGGFPTSSFNSTNYWVDVVYTTDITNPPALTMVTSVTPTTNSIAVGISAKVSATFNSTMVPSTFTASTFQVLDSSSNPVPGRISYNAADNTVTFDAGSPLAYAATYTVVIRGGSSGVHSYTGATLASDCTWSFTTAPPPQTGPGGPILIITTTSNPFSSYYAEILRAEGLDEFATADISRVTASTLTAYDVVILGEMPLTSTQVTMLSTWVNAGGDLIAMRPDKQLAGLLGLSDASGSLSNAYLLVNTTSGPGAGIVDQTIQFHGTADSYNLDGATSVATLYATATKATSNPAVTERNVGSGHAAAFTYDLARSVVYTRQGNPAWAGEERDGVPVIRSDDLFYGNASYDPEPDWVDLNKVAIPQADEQQRLLAKMITQIELDKEPLPSFWYFPNGAKAVVIMTGDDHANGGTAGRFDTYVADGTSGGQPIRSSSYIYPKPLLTDSEAAAYAAQGFEVGVHVSTDGIDYTSYSQLASIFSDQLSQFLAQYPSLPTPSSNRTHCIVWSDWDSEPKVELSNRMRLDENYYYYPASWVQDRPGMFTGSGIPMRFASQDGTMIDVYQAATQMTDESGQSYPYTIDALLDAATGSEGYYGAFCANMHTDTAASPGSDAIIASAQAHNVPVLSGRQELAWLDGRNGSSFGSLAWDGSTGTMSFTITTASGADGLQAMLPTRSANGVLSGIMYNGTPITYTTQLIKRVQYAFFAAGAGSYRATYSPDTTPPSVVGQSPVAGASNATATVVITATFSEPIQLTTLSFVLKDASNNAVAATVTYDAGTYTATLTPSNPLGATTTYTATVSGAQDLAGNTMTTPVSWSFTTSSTSTIWGNTAKPAVASFNDPSPIELGVKFSTSVSGTITGIRFYKGSLNTGTHVGHLWTNTGTLLATATFTGESATGWQEVDFANPVNVASNTVYVASYYAPAGDYATSGAYFASSGVDSGPLHVLSNAEGSGNGVYTYGSGGGFPTSSFNATNYWVDVVFVQTSSSNPPAVTAQSPGSGASGVSSLTSVSATFSEPVQAGTISFGLNDSTGNAVAGTSSYYPTTNTVTFTPNSPLAPSTQYTVTVSGAMDHSGNVMTAPASWTFTTSATASDTLWSSATTPTVASVNDPSPVSLGVKFESSVAGYLSGIRFYKGLGNTGTHFGYLWSSSGTLLASATFTTETATGWQQVTFANPVPITINTVYVASYYAPNGNYAADGAYFASTGVTSGPLHGLSNAESTGNGVYVYGSGGGFPSSSYNATNYWVDVVFNPGGVNTPPPTVTTQTPALNTTGIPTISSVSATFSEPVQPNTISFTLTDASGYSVNGTVSYNAATETATFTPSAALAASTQYTATITGVTDFYNHTLAAPVTWSFTTSAQPTFTLWNGAATPLTASANDPLAVELGVKFQSAVPGYIIGILFYKGASNTGTHAGHLWNASGNLLATATFTNETATGWQQVTFANPVAIAANTVYIASYYAPNGGYAAAGGYFAGSGFSSGPLTALSSAAAGGNGLFTYGGGFPTGSYNATNYWIDVDFTPANVNTPPPAVTTQAPASGATNVSTITPVSVTFSNAILPGTISFTLADSSGNPVAGSLTYDATSSTATFTPNTPLAISTQYTATVSGATDLYGHTMTPVSWSFTTTSIWTQTTVADFTAGTQSNTMVDPSAGGVTLASSVSDDFSEGALSSAWTTNSWTPAGGGPTSVTLSGSVLSVAGAEVLLTTTIPDGVGVEGSVNFAAAPYQHFGMATDLSTLSGNSWAIFSTGGTNDTLFARVNASGTTQDVNLGALPSGYHDYKIQPVSGGIQFSVDGVVLTTINLSIPTGTPLRIVMSAFNGAPQPLLQVDRVCLTSSYVSSGTFTSSVFDAGRAATWGNATWTADLPPGTTLVIETSSSTDGTTWSDWSEVGSGGAITSPSGRYLRYCVLLTTTDPMQTATLSDITFTWN